MPNPGPSGSGVSIFLSNPDLIIDAGITTGINSNNVAELVALSICLTELTRVFPIYPFKRAVIFCDSQYAILMASTSKTPVSNKGIVAILRQTFSRALEHFPVNLLWLRAHAGVGGNERVDKLAKFFAKSNGAAPPPFVLASPPTYCSSIMPWEPGFPLLGLPLSAFCSDLPIFCGMLGVIPMQTTPPPLLGAPPSQGRGSKCTNARNLLATQAQGPGVDLSCSSHPNPILVADPNLRPPSLSRAPTHVFSGASDPIVCPALARPALRRSARLNVVVEDLSGLDFKHDC